MTATPDTLHRLLLRVPNRRRIYERIVRRPGCHVRGLSRDLAISASVVSHHVKQLQRHDMVFEHVGGRRRTLYATGHIDGRDAILHHHLGKPLCAEILQAILHLREASVTEVADQVGRPTTTVSHHLRAMRDDGLLDNIRVGRSSIFLVASPDRVGCALPTTQTYADPADLPGLEGLVHRAAAWTPQAIVEA